jgi:hypothetical protein
LWEVQVCRLEVPTVNLGLLPNAENGKSAHRSELRTRSGALENT